MEAQALDRTELDELDEFAAPAPEQNPGEHALYGHSSLEDERSRRRESTSVQSRAAPERLGVRVSGQLRVISYLVFFSILGVLARLGLQALSLYPGAPIAIAETWANVAGTFVLGFLREDQLLFRSHQYAASQDTHQDANSTQEIEAAAPSPTKAKAGQDSAKQAALTKKTAIPLYIGMTVGFCGTFTSFSSMIRDAFLAMSNDLNTAPTSSYTYTSQHRDRSAGYSVLAVLAVLYAEVSMSWIALKTGAHLAVAVQNLLNSLPSAKPKATSGKFVELTFMALAWCTWLGAVLMSIWPPYNRWRGQALFAIVFAPAGCVLRFYLSIKLNRVAISFPLGTFAANILGTCVLGMAWDLQYSSLAIDTVGCQVLQGVEDGFCGALTTVSTWVLELDGLRTHHAYIYGACSLGLSLTLLTTIMGSLRWTEGFAASSCTA